jgi:guanyl-specific ribonuclease Sa
VDNPALGALEALPSPALWTTPRVAAGGPAIQRRHILHDLGAPILTHAGTVAAHKLLLEAYAAGRIATGGNKTVAELFADFSFENSWGESFELQPLVDTWTPAWDAFLLEIRRSDATFDFAQVQARWQAADNTLEQSFIAFNNRGRETERLQVAARERSRIDIKRIVRHTEIPGITGPMATLLAGGGTVFRNRGGRLPLNANANYYKKEDIPDADRGAHRGARRLIRGLGNEFYYTAQHYEEGSFNIVVGGGAVAPYSP